MLFALRASLPLLALSRLPLVAASYTVSKTNCTLPIEKTNFVFGPNTRGTMSILWNCLSVVLLCTWKILYLNIPACRKSLPKSHPWYKRLPKAVWFSVVNSMPKVRWMVFSVLAPEFIFGRALNERFAAQLARDNFNEWDMGRQNATRNKPGGLQNDEHEAERSATKESRRSTSGKSEGRASHKAKSYEAKYTEVHGYFANMGGYYLDFTLVQDQQDGEGPEIQEEISGIGKKVLRVSSIPVNTPAKTPQRQPKFRSTADKHRLSREKWCLTFAELAECRRRGLFDELPEISERDILGRSDHGDALVKALAICQVTWLAIQLIVRHTRNLPSSQLEIAVLAYAVTSFISYIILWDRPGGMEFRQVIVPNKRYPDAKEIEQVASFSPSYYCTKLWSKLGGRSNEDSVYNVIPIPDDALHYVDREDLHVFLYGVVFGAVVFGAIHCLAWNFTFPTPTESLLWKICSILTCAIPLIASVPGAVYARARRAHKSKTDAENQVVRIGRKRSGPPNRKRVILGWLLALAFAIPYILARLFLIVEMFRSLLHLPPDAFKETWSGSFPHWG